MILIGNIIPKPNIDDDIRKEAKESTHTGLAVLAAPFDKS
jgi:hypothetical protein